MSSLDLFDLEARKQHSTLVFRTHGSFA